MPFVFDNFNRANGGLGSNWTTMPNQNAPVISNQAILDGNVADATMGGAYWSNTSTIDFNNHPDQWVEGKLSVTAISAHTYSYIGVRASSSTDTFYRLYRGYNATNDYKCFVQSIINGAFSQTIIDLTDAKYSAYTGYEYWRLEAYGTTIVVYVRQNATDGWTRVASATNSEISDGFPWLAGYNVTGATTYATVDDWAAGDLDSIPNNLTCDAPYGTKSRITFEGVSGATQYNYYLRAASSGLPTKSVYDSTGTISSGDFIPTTANTDYNIVITATVGGTEGDESAPLEFYSKNTASVSEDFSSGAGTLGDATYPNWTTNALRHDLNVVDLGGGDYAAVDSDDTLTTGGVEMYTATDVLDFSKCLDQYGIFTYSQETATYQNAALFLRGNPSDLFNYSVYTDPVTQQLRPYRYDNRATGTKFQVLATIDIGYTSYLAEIKGYPDAVVKLYGRNATTDAWTYIDTYTDTSTLVNTGLPGIGCIDDGTDAGRIEYFEAGALGHKPHGLKLVKAVGVAAKFDFDEVIGATSYKYYVRTAANGLPSKSTYDLTGTLTPGKSFGGLTASTDYNVVFTAIVDGVESDESFAISFNSGIASLTLLADTSGWGTVSRSRTAAGIDATAWKEMVGASAGNELNVWNDTLIYVGRQYDMDWGAYLCHRGCLSFDLTDIPDCVRITSATFKAYVEMEQYSSTYYWGLMTAHHGDTVTLADYDNTCREQLASAVIGNRTGLQTFSSLADLTKYVNAFSGRKVRFKLRDLTFDFDNNWATNDQFAGITGPTGANPPQLALTFANAPESALLPPIPQQAVVNDGKYHIIASNMPHAMAGVVFERINSLDNYSSSGYWPFWSTTGYVGDAAQFSIHHSHLWAAPQSFTYIEGGVGSTLVRFRQEDDRLTPIELSRWRENTSLPSDANHPVSDFTGRLTAMYESGGQIWLNYSDDKSMGSGYDVTVETFAAPVSIKTLTGTDSFPCIAVTGTGWAKILAYTDEVASVYHLYNKYTQDHFDNISSEELVASNLYSLSSYRIVGIKHDKFLLVFRSATDNKLYYATRGWDLLDVWTTPVLISDDTAFDGDGYFTVCADGGNPYTASILYYDGTDIKRIFYNDGVFSAPEVIVANANPTYGQFQAPYYCNVEFYFVYQEGRELVKTLVTHQSATSIQSNAIMIAPDASPHSGVGVMATMGQTFGDKMALMYIRTPGVAMCNRFDVPTQTWDFEWTAPTRKSYRDLAHDVANLFVDGNGYVYLAEAGRSKDYAGLGSHDFNDFVVFKSAYPLNHASFTYDFDEWTEISEDLFISGRGYKGILVDRNGVIYIVTSTGERTFEILEYRNGAWSSLFTYIQHNSTETRFGSYDNTYCMGLCLGDEADPAQQSIHLFTGIRHDETPSFGIWAIYYLKLVPDGDGTYTAYDSAGNDITSTLPHDENGGDCVYMGEIDNYPTANNLLANIRGDCVLVDGVPTLACTFHPPDNGDPLVDTWHPGCYIFKPDGIGGWNRIIVHAPTDDSVQPGVNSLAKMAYTSGGILWYTAAWDGDIQLIRSADDGATWGEPVAITSVPDGGSVVNPHIIPIDANSGLMTFTAMNFINGAEALYKVTALDVAPDNVDSKGCDLTFPTYEFYAGATHAEVHRSTTTPVAGDAGTRIADNLTTTTYHDESGNTGDAYYYTVVYKDVSDVEVGRTSETYVVLPTFTELIALLAMMGTDESSLKRARAAGAILNANNQLIGIQNRVRSTDGSLSATASLTVQSKRIREVQSELPVTIDVTTASKRIRMEQSELSSDLALNTSFIRDRAFQAALPSTLSLENFLTRLSDLAALNTTSSDLTTHLMRFRPIQSSLNGALDIETAMKVQKLLLGELVSDLPLNVTRLTRQTDQTAELLASLIMSGHLHHVIDFATELNTSHDLVLHPLQRLNDIQAALATVMTAESGFERIRSLQSVLSGAIISTSGTMDRWRMQQADLASTLSLESILYIPSILGLSADLSSQLEPTQNKFDRVRNMDAIINNDLNLTVSARIVAIINLLASLDSTSDITSDTPSRIRVLDAELGGYLYITGNMIIIDVPGIPTLLYDRTGNRRIYLYDRTGQTLISPEDLN